MAAKITLVAILTFSRYPFSGICARKQEREKF